MTGAFGPPRRVWASGCAVLAITTVAAVMLVGDPHHGRRTGAAVASGGCPRERPRTAVTSAAWPAPLSASRQPAPIGSPSGGGVFGRWLVDGAGLPAFAFTGSRSALARASIGGRTEGWSLIGNDHVNALASTSGTVQLWSEDRRNQWVNRADAGAGQYVGGFGFLRLGGQTFSTLTADAGPGAGLVFGIGYVRRCRQAGSVGIDERVYAPFGDDPVLLHDVVLRNLGARTIRASWTEFWDVNPYDQPLHQPIATGSPRWDARRRLLTVSQAGGDAEPAGDLRRRSGRPGLGL